MRRFDVLSVWWESSGESSGLRVVIVLVELPVSVFVFFFFLFWISCAVAPTCLYRVVAILIYWGESLFRETGAAPQRRNRRQRRGGRSSEGVAGGGGLGFLSLLKITSVQHQCSPKPFYLTISHRDGQVNYTDYVHYLVKTISVEIDD
jgi:hypothetical protein